MRGRISLAACFSIWWLNPNAACWSVRASGMPWSRSLIPRGRGWRPSTMASAGAPRAPSCLGLGRRGLSLLRSLHDGVSCARRTSPCAWHCASPSCGRSGAFSCSFSRSHAYDAPQGDQHADCCCPALGPSSGRSGSGPGKQNPLNRSKMTHFGSRALEFAAMRNANLMVFAAATRDGTNRHKARSGRMEAFGGKHTLRTLWRRSAGGV